MHPDNIGVAPVTVAEIPTVVPGPGDAVGAQDFEPADRLDGVEQNEHVLLDRQIEDGVHLLEVDRVGCRQISRRPERCDAFARTAIGVAGSTVVAQEVYPEGIDAVARSILHVERGFGQGEVADQGLRIPMIS